MGQVVSQVLGAEMFCSLIFSRGYDQRMTALRIDIDRGNSRVITLIGEIDAEKARWAIEVSSSFFTHGHKIEASC